MATQHCPKCGREVDAGAMAGLCPACLLQAGLAAVSATTTPFGSGFTAPPLAELAPHFPQLELLEILGQGGMGAVYKARQIRLDRLVALKILPKCAGQEAAFADRFAREAKALARLSHPNIITIHDYGEAGGWFYFSMEYVDGVNLRQAIKAKTVEPPQALSVVSQVCDALQYAHEEGVVHRDIKPENILLDKRGRVKIADFGLAKLLGQTSVGRPLTHTHQVMGTLGYMAPEQMEGSREVDHRADLYAVGVVFYELLTGELPLGRFAPPSQMVQVDVRIDEVVLKTLEKEPERRYQRASQIKDDVERISNSAGPTVLPAPQVARERGAGEDSWSPRPSRRSVSSTAVAVVLGFAAIVLMGLSAGGLTWVTAAGAVQEPLREPFSGLPASIPVWYAVSGALLIGALLSVLFGRQGTMQSPVRVVFIAVALGLMLVGLLLTIQVIRTGGDPQSLEHTLGPVIRFSSEAYGWIAGFFAGGLTAIFMILPPFHLTRRFWIGLAIALVLIVLAVSAFAFSTVQEQRGIRQLPGFYGTRPGHASLVPAGRAFGTT